MKALLMIFLLLLSMRLLAPSATRMFIAKIEPIKYDPILRAFQWVESSFRTDVTNSLGYTGILQIGEEMVNEANRINKIHGIIESFTLTDALDSTKSVKMWYIIQNYRNPSYDLKKACVIWNPTASEKYYQKILDIK